MKHKVLFWSMMGVSLLAGGVLLGVGISMGGMEYLEEEHTVTVHSDEHLSTEYANVENLEIDLAACDVTMKEGEDFSISGKNIISEITDNGETWHVYSPRKKWYKWFRKGRAGEVTVTLPSEKQFEDVEISFAAAEVDIEKLSARNLEIEGGAGSATIDKLLVTEELDLGVGAGQLIVKSGEISGEHSISCGAGEMDLALQKLEGDMDVSCGMGEINLTLPGAKKDYTFNHSAVMGSVNIEAGEQGGLTTGTGSLADIDLSCGMGAINVDFQ